LFYINDLESYIKTNGHLPDVPNAEQVQKAGVSIGEMNAILLKKIEEMTLHLIELEKKNTQLQQKIEAIEAAK